MGYYRGLVNQYFLLESGGSDFHGDAKPDGKLGSVKIPYELVEKMKDAQERLNK